jgi:hypothetical protein
MMAGESNYQYRPTPVIGTGDPVTVGDLLTMARNVNNTKAFGVVHKMRSQPFWPWVYSADSHTDELVTLVMAPVFIPEGFETIRWTLGHKRTGGGSTVAWKLYCTDHLYIGPQNAIDTDKLGPDYTSDTLTTNQDNWFPEHGLLDIVRDEATGLSFLLLTSQNGDGSTRGAINALDATPRIE